MNAANMVTITKPGEPTLRILAESLEQHVKLGWKRVEEDAEPAAEKQSTRGKKVSEPAAEKQE